MVLDIKSELTAGEIARRLNVPLHRVTYLLEARQMIPSGRAGLVRVYPEAVLGRVRDELTAMDAKRKPDSI